MLAARARFLIVDDDGGLAGLFARILRLDGHDVRTATTGASALADIATWRPDGILLDYRMPLMNGLGFLYRLREQETGACTPVALITGDAVAAGTIRAECAALGATLHIKPLVTAEVLAIARELIANNPSLPSRAADPAKVLATRPE
jgi:DNA-binding response OmpR family regulator